MASPAMAADPAAGESSAAHDARALKSAGVCGVAGMDGKRPNLQEAVGTSPTRTIHAAHRSFDR